jgi:NADPH:quinone reductase-like Zn-dependent oxidoreductase
MTATATAIEITTTAEQTMKAIAQHRYGPPSVLALTDIPKPEVGTDGILVRVRAASVNALDWHFLRGQPYVLRMSEGMRAPKQAVRGVDLSGVVEAVGPEVTEFAAGDEVFGIRSGAWAEYVVGRLHNFALKPAGWTFEEAAAAPTAGETALQGLRDQGHLKSGQSVLVYGAGGGVGHMAVQIAKALGATVTAVTRSESVELVRSLGADRVMDYRREDVTRGEDRFDVVYDVGANRSLRDLRRVLKPEGVLVLAGGAKGNWIRPLKRPIAAMIRERLRGQRVHVYLSDHKKEDLVTLQQLADAGTIRPSIEQTYPLAEAAAALAHVESGRARGKIVLTI